MRHGFSSEGSGEDLGVCAYSANPLVPAAFPLKGHGPLISCGSLSQVQISGLDMCRAQAYRQFGSRGGGGEVDLDGGDVVREVADEDPQLGVEYPVPPRP